jgi:hypothetical protein
MRVFVNPAVVSPVPCGCATLAWRLLVEPGPRRMALADRPRSLGHGYALNAPDWFALVARPV